MFRFARAIHALENYCECPLTENGVRNALTQWWEHERNEYAAVEDFEECLFVFKDAYKRVKVPLGANVIQSAIDSLATTMPPKEAERYTSQRIRTLIHLCHLLQELVGDAPFFLSTRQAAKAIGIAKFELAGAYLNGLVHDGILQIVTRGTSGPRGKATRFRYVKRPA